MVLLGYVEGSKAYRLYDPRGGKVVVSRDVMFDEMEACDWKDPGMGEAGGIGGMFVIEHMAIRRGGNVGAEEPAVDVPSLAVVAAPGEGEPPSPAASSLHQRTCTRLHHSPLLR